MIQQFATKKDIIGAFADAMNLISPEVQDHHEKVAYIAFRLAETIGMDAGKCRTAFMGGLLHDIGGVLKQGDISLIALELQAGQVASAGAALLETFSETEALAPVVKESQTPWQHLKKTNGELNASRQIGQIVHLADAVSLLLDGSGSVLNRIGDVKRMVHCVEATEFSPEILSAFDQLCLQESVWMDVMYRPESFLDLITDDRWLTLDEVVRLTEFMSRIIDYRSPFTAMHSAGVAATASILAELSGMSEDECKMMRIAGYLHDVGKLKIPDEILEKPGKLTDEEFNIMKEHAYYTWIILKDIRGFEQIKTWAAFHHEKLNGTGYPFHLSESELPLGTRIMAVSDIFSAITEDRPYRKGMDRAKVVAVLQEDAQRGLISARLVSLLLEHYDLINDRRDKESREASKKYQETLATASKETK